MPFWAHKHRQCAQNGIVFPLQVGKLRFHACKQVISLVSRDRNSQSNWQENAQSCFQNTLDAILDWWKYKILVSQKEWQNLNSLFCKQRLMTVNSSHLDLIVPWPSFQDNTEESVAMSTTSKSNAFKASRREDNDNHAAVANIKGTSSVFILRFLPLNSDFQKTCFFGIYESKYRKSLKETHPRIGPAF